jgi:hypothetical protein
LWLSSTSTIKRLPVLSVKMFHQTYQMHFINNEIGDEEVSVDQPVDLEVVVVFAEWIDQSFGNLFIEFIDFLLDLFIFNGFNDVLMDLDFIYFLD